MALSIAVVILLSLGADYVLRRWGLPGLLGMLLVGLACGPHGLDLISPSLMAISTDFRRIALIVILLRAGLMISKESLRRMGRPALLMGLLPALFEAATVAAVAGPVLGLRPAAAMALGALLAAVGPAVVVPKMLALREEGRGTNKYIPELLLASSPLDNIFVLLLFGALLEGARAGYSQVCLKLAELPVSLVLGGLAGVVLGKRLYRGFLRFDPRATKRMLILLCLGILLLALEDALKGRVPFSGLMAIMAVAFVILEKSEPFAHELSLKLAKLWIFAEILLFVLMGAQVDLGAVWHAAGAGLVVVVVGLVARSMGVWLALLKTDLNVRERFFCVVAYMPKASVQAALAATPLALGVAGGETILAVAVLAVLVTAPLGAMATDWAGKRWLQAVPPPKQDSAGEATI
ncbi:MAG: cation:proton antiporter [Armatimonadia bacterium]